MSGLNILVGKSLGVVNAGSVPDSVGFEVAGVIEFV
jgi:hypothetical protein